MNHLLLVSLGGAIGAGLRFMVGNVAIRFFGVSFPWATLIVNVAGSLLMGILIGVLVRRTGTPNEVRIFLATGLLGGFTTFSAFSLDAINLWQRGESTIAAGYVLASVILSLFALFVGLIIVRSIV
ncbi:MAG: fluoride efflux transporter CrcB [Hyphomicrobiales bacterium]|nr:fluoride efflux transporter CrcB [Hyphomicrobiales bacterium]